MLCGNLRGASSKNAGLLSSLQNKFYYANQAGCIAAYPPGSATSILGLKACATLSGLLATFISSSLIQDRSTGPTTRTDTAFRPHSYSAKNKILLAAPTFQRTVRVLPFSICSGVRDTVTSSLPPTREVRTSGLDIRMKGGMKTKREGRVCGEGLAGAEPVPGVRVLAFFVVLASGILGTSSLAL